MELVIIESPYAGEIARNVAYARACVRDSLMRGEAPYASHLLYTQPGILRDDVPGERRHGIETGLQIARLAKRAALYLDFGMSSGMRVGRDRHISEGRIVEERYLEPELVLAIMGKSDLDVAGLADLFTPFPRF